jgi:hypothetical protein
MPLFGFIGRNNKYDPSNVGNTDLPWGVGDSELEQNKIARYNKNWRSYLAHGVNEEERLQNTGAASRGSTEGKVNYVRTVINRMKSFAFSKRWHAFLEFEPFVDATTGEAGELNDLPEDVRVQRRKLAEMLRYADKVYHKRNAGDSVRLETALFCSVCGDGYLVAVPVLPDSLEVDINGEATNLDQSRIRVMSVNPENAKPEYSHDGQELVKLTLRYPIALPDTQGQGLMVQTITKSEITEEVQAAGSAGAIRSKTIPNPLGRVYAVHIKNAPAPGKYGIDDVSDIRGAVQELNDKISDISDIIDYHASPTTLVFGARVSTLEKGANKVWSGLPTTAKVENLELSGDLSAMNTYVDLLRTMIKEGSGVNEAALGSDLAISNTSGVALHTRFYSMLSLAEDKWAAWSQPVKDFYGIILLWGRQLRQLSFSDEDYLDFMDALELTFYSNLPKDELLEIQKNTEMVNAGLKPREKAIADLGSKDPKADLVQIRKDRALLGNQGDQNSNLENSIDNNNEDGIESGSTGRNVADFRAPTEANPASTSSNT